MTQDEFLKHEIALWGEEYIFDLLDRGFTLKLTTAGYKWVLPAVTTTTAGMDSTTLDTTSGLCYTSAVGAV